MALFIWSPYYRVGGLGILKKKKKEKIKKKKKKEKKKEKKKLLHTIHHKLATKIS